MDIRLSFAREAVKNGCRKNGLCEGWDWIRENLSRLDSIFETEEYKKQDGMKYKCMPYLITEEMSEEEKYAIETAWYLNNKREKKREKAEYKNRMLAENYLPLNVEIVKKAFAEKKKILVVAKMSMDWLTNKIEEVFKPVISPDGQCYLMKLKARSRGYHITRFEDAFCKLV